MCRAVNLGIAVPSTLQGWERGGTHGRDGGQDIEWAWLRKLL
jgi:hypothetical protein